MQSVGTTSLTVDGHDETNISNKLKSFFDLSPTKCKPHILNAATNSVTIKVANGNGKCIALSGIVYLYWGDCNNDLDELAETCLFEMNNAIHQKTGAYDTINKKLTAIGFLQLGLLSAKKESESSSKVVELLNDLATHGYTISSWGQDQKSAVEAGGDFKMHFANDVHDSAAPRGKEQALKSKHMYAYQRLKKYGGLGKTLWYMRSHFKCMADAKPPSKPKIDAQAYSAIFTYFTTDIDIKALGWDQFIVYYITILEHLANSWTITWKKFDTYSGTWCLFRDAIAHNFALSRNIHGTASQKILDKFLEYE